MNNLPSRAAVAVFESRGLNGQEFLIAQIKEQAAVLHDLFDSVHLGGTLEREPGRLVALAKTELESSVMWAVKATSRLSGPNA